MHVDQLEILLIVYERLIEKSNVENNQKTATATAKFFSIYNQLKGSS